MPPYRRVIAASDAAGSKAANWRGGKLRASGGRSALAERLRLSAEEAGLPVSLSVGWSSRQGAEALEETIRRADLRLLERRGRERGIDSPKEEGGAVLERLLRG